MHILHASTSFYEILLIVLVIILIFNGLLRREVLKKVNANLSNHPSDDNSIKNHTEVKISSRIEGEYVDYEIIKD